MMKGEKQEEENKDKGACGEGEKSNSDKMGRRKYIK